MIKALIFDLDSCLAAANEPGEILFAEAFQAVRSANKGEVSEGHLRAAFQDCWRFPFDFIAEKYGFSPAMRAAGFAAFCRVEVRQPMRGYGDLDELAQLPARLFLVTSGFRRLQESKIRALGIQHLFKGIHIDAIDEQAPKGKLNAFQAILLDYHSNRRQPGLRNCGWQPVGNKNCSGSATRCARFIGGHTPDPESAGTGTLGAEAERS